MNPKAFTQDRACRVCSYCMWSALGIAKMNSTELPPVHDRVKAVLTSRMLDIRGTNWRPRLLVGQ
jgi:hypothetical protein